MASCTLLPTRRLSSPAPSWSSTGAISPSRRSLMPCTDTGRVSLFFEDAGIGTPPVLLLHELGGCSESWRAVIALLAPDHRVIAVDMRCAGRSEKPPGPFTLADVADDLD